MNAKFRHRLTPQQRFERALRVAPGEDPVFPAIMHSFERHLHEATDLSEIDRAVADVLRRRTEISRAIIQSLVNHWHSVPDDVKARFVPLELRALSPAHKLDDALLAKLLRALGLAVAYRKKTKSHQYHRDQPVFERLETPSFTPAEAATASSCDHSDCSRRS